MLKIIELHYSLLQYLRIELKKQKTPRALIVFCRNTAVRYCQAMFQEYRTLFITFDPLYKQQKADFDKQKKLKTDLQHAWKITQYLLFILPKKLGKNHHEQKRIRLDFIKNGQIPKELMEALLRELK